MKYTELTGICKQCLGYNKIENPLFTGIKECEYCSTEQIQTEQMMIGGLNEQIQK